MSRHHVSPFGARLAHVALAAAIAVLWTASAARALPPLPNDHLLGYKASADKNATLPGTPFPKDVTRSPVDDFGAPGLCTILKEKALYNPADKNGEGIQNPTLHYVGYQVKCPVKVSETRTYFDQLFPSGVVVSTSKVRSILVPSGKSTTLTPDPAAPATGTNHYLCYKAKGPKMTPVTVSVDDQFGSRSLELSKIQAVCNPADKDGDDPAAISDVDHYVCYKAKPASKGTFPTVRTNNSNFGANTLAPKGELELCIPAFADVVPTTTITSTTTTTLPPPVCGNLVVDVGEDCELDADCPSGDACTDVCTCIDSQCPDRVDWTVHAGFGAFVTNTHLDLGYTGFAHDMDIADGAGVTLSIATVSGSGPAACAVATIGGINPSPGNCRCASDNRAVCDQPFAADADDCAGAQCVCYFAPPEPLWLGSSFCLLRRFSGDITGTWNVDTGSAELNVLERDRLHVGGSATAPCPYCSGDMVANDGIRDGTCVDGANAGQSCDANSAEATFPAPGGGSYSWDCFPSPGFNVTGLGLRADAVVTTGARSLTAALACTGGTCPCGSCSADPTVPCTNNADCSAASAGTCSAASIMPNHCDTGVCNDIGGGEGQCDSGPDETFCDAVTRANGDGLFYCSSNADCDADIWDVDAGNCTLVKRRECFTNSIVATGTPSTGTPTLVSETCMARTSNPAIDSTFGFPGVQEVYRSGATQFRCAGDPGSNYPTCP